MIPVNPNSSSVILRATHILFLRVKASQPGEWSSAPTGGVSRAVDLNLELEKVLKGTTRERPGDQFQVRVIQYGTGTSRKFAIPGVWSHQSLDEGTELLAFCRSHSNEVVELLDEASCEQVLPASDALTTVRLVLQIETENLPPPDLFALVQPAAALLDYTFVQYLWAQLSQSALVEIDIFELLMQFLETPTLTYMCRATLLDLVYSLIYASGTASEEHLCRFAITMFRLLGVSEAKSLHDNIIGVFLPNLLGLTGGAPKCDVNDIFREYPADRSLATNWLRDYRGVESTDALLDWLR